MKTKLIYLLIFLPIWSSCEKETMDYEGKEGIYFDVQWTDASWITNSATWPHQFYTPVEFGKTGGEDKDLSLTVRATGTIKDYDRSFQVYVVKDSTTAIEGDDYELLGSDYVIKAGETSVDVLLKIKKSTRLSVETVRVQLALLPNEYFELPFTTFGSDMPGRLLADVDSKFSANRDPRIHNIYANDFITQPNRWYTYWGDYSDKKFRIMMEISGTTPEEYDKNNDLMPSQRALVIAEQVAKYLIAEKDKGTPVLDEDGTVMWVRGVTWAEGTTPEQLTY